MQTSINLQQPSEYLIIPLIVVLVLIGIIAYIIIHIQKNSKIVEDKIIKVIPQKNIKNIPIIKEKYIEQLNEINTKYQNQRIDLRLAYQKISSSIRMFIFEVTDVETQNYTLEEIKKIDMPILYELIEEYYEPEFALKSEGNFDEAIKKARRIIETWK